MRKKSFITILGVLLLTFQVFSLLVSPSQSAPFAILTDANVTASRIGGGAGGYGYTNSSGQYTITTGITKTGDYSFEASAPGHLSSTINATITTLNDTIPADFTLNRSAIVMGNVIGFDGFPVVGASVELHGTDGSFFFDSTETDSDGKYYFATGIDTGSYYVNVSFSFPFENIAWSIVYGGNYTGMPTWAYRDAPYRANGYIEEGSDTIAVTAGLVTTVPDMVLAESGVITGFVQDSLHAPIPYATVRYQSLATFESHVVLADANGMYRISYDVVDGQYEVQSYSWSYVVDSDVINATQAGTVNKNFTMIKSASISGYFMRTSDDKPIPGALIGFTSDDYHYIESAFTDFSGYYEVDNGLGPGNYTATVMLTGIVLNVTNFPLTTGETLAIDFKGDAYFISGTVYENVTGGPVRVPNPSVDLNFIEAPFPPEGSASGDENGTYEIVLPVQFIYDGQTLQANFTVGAYQYNMTEVTRNVTVGNDATFDFALFPSPPSTPLHSATIIGTIYGTPGPALPFSHQVWHLSSLNYSFTVEVNSTSMITYVYANLDGSGFVSVYAWGPEGTNGTLTIWIPLDIYFGPFTVNVSPGTSNVLQNAQYNSTHQIIVVEYSHSYEYISIDSEHWLPEYPAPALVMIGMAAIGAFVLFEKKRRTLKTN